VRAAEASASIERGRQAAQQGRHAEAVEHLTRAVELEPGSFEAYLQLAAAHNALGNIDRAIDAMKRAREQRPGNAVVYYNIATLSAGRGQRWVARVYYWETLRLAGYDASLVDKQSLLESVYRALDLLGPMTKDEISEIPKEFDARNNPCNSELAQCSKELEGPHRAALTLRFQVALLRSRLLLPTAAPQPGDRNLGLPGSGKPFRAELLAGPDRRDWFPVFTDMSALLAYKSADCAAMPAVVIARIALETPGVTGLLINPTAAGGGLPVEGPALEALSKGAAVRLEL
jgi:tetratricopeptide (TPR) repeat protein